MSREEGLAVAIMLALFSIVCFYFYLRIREMREQLDKLNQRTYELVTESLFRIEQGQRRDLDRKLEALQNHLGVITVYQELKTIVVKKGCA